MPRFLVKSGRGRSRVEWGFGGGVRRFYEVSWGVYGGFMGVPLINGDRVRVWVGYGYGVFGVYGRGKVGFSVILGYKKGSILKNLP